MDDIFLFHRFQHVGNFQNEQLPVNYSINQAAVCACMQVKWFNKLFKNNNDMLETTVFITNSYLHEKLRFPV